MSEINKSKRSPKLYLVLLGLGVILSCLPVLVYGPNFLTVPLFPHGDQTNGQAIWIILFLPPIGWTLGLIGLVKIVRAKRKTGRRKP